MAEGLQASDWLNPGLVVLSAELAVALGRDTFSVPHKTALKHVVDSVWEGIRHSLDILIVIYQNLRVFQESVCHDC